MKELIGTTARRRVLVLDDEPSVVSALRRSFTSAFGLDLVFEGFTSAPTALDRLRQVDDLGEFDAVVVDQRMPLMTGAEFLAQALVLCPRTPSIMLSGQSSTEELARAVNEGRLWRFVAKPWSDAQLVDTLLAAFVERDRLVHIRDVGIDD